MALVNEKKTDKEKLIKKKNILSRKQARVSALFPRLLVALRVDQIKLKAGKK